MRSAVITLVLSVCLVVSVAYPEPYPRSQRGVQEMLAHAAGDNPRGPFYADGVRAQIDIPTSPEELYECANKNCDNKVCVPCTKGTTCVKKILGKCVVRKPIFGQCCTNTPDLQCLAEKEACNQALETLSG